MAKLSATIVNRQARFNYEIIETYTAGLVLTGPEVLSLREGKANISEAFCIIDEGQAVLKNMQISKPNTALAVDMPSEIHDRKLLLNKREIEALYKKAVIVGNSIIPLRVYRNSRGLFKMEIALCRGKKNYDKRETIKERDTKKDIERSLKNYG